jgi:hypothetical protein
MVTCYRTRAAPPGPKGEKRLAVIGAGYAVRRELKVRVSNVLPPPFG